MDEDSILGESISLSASAVDSDKADLDDDSDGADCILELVLYSSLKRESSDKSLCCHWTASPLA